jgi:ABC-type hemin transport system substrate-binding protein
MRSKILFCFICLFIYHFPFLTSVCADYAEPPKRIISVAPNIAEILFALGPGDNVVGITNFCNYPEEAKKNRRSGTCIKR